MVDGNAQALYLCPQLRLAQELLIAYLQSIRIKPAADVLISMQDQRQLMCPGRFSAPVRPADNIPAAVILWHGK